MAMSHLWQACEQTQENVFAKKDGQVTNATNVYQIQNVQIKAQILAFYQMNAFVKVGQSQKYFRFELEYMIMS